MTIPTRPAPAPPSGLSAAAGANASLERLRLQLEQQQEQQLQQNERLGGVQKLTIKLPPPPPKTVNTNGFYQGTNLKNDGATSITRKFPSARYAPATNWDDAAYDAFPSANNRNAFGKKVAPPRPPPPKINNGRKSTAPAPPISPRPPTSVNILSNIFNRKKQTKAAYSSRIYGVSSGVSSETNSVDSSYTSWNTTKTAVGTTSNVNNSSSGAIYNFASSTFETCKSSSTTTPLEAQLINFDSPPSSPTFTQKSNSDCVSVDSFSSDSNFSSPNNGSASQPESGFEDDFGSMLRNRQSTTSPLDPWETLGTLGQNTVGNTGDGRFIGTARVRNLNAPTTRLSTDNPLCNGKSLLPPAPTLQVPTIIKPKISQKPKAPKPPMVQQNKYAALTSISTTNYSSSMNNGGVSLLDVITGKADALQLSDNESLYNGSTTEHVQPYGIALYDFYGLEDGDLSFRENEKICLLEQVSEEWYRGRTRSGCEGIFPVNYVDIKVPLTPCANKTDAPTSTTMTNHWPTARSLYHFPAEVPGDLALKENDLVTIYYKVNDDWLYGEVEKRVGQFPANFVDYVPANLPQMP